MKNKLLLVLLAMVLIVSLAAFGACAAPVEEEEKAPLIEEKAPPKEEKAPVVKEKAPPKEEKEAPPVEEIWEWPDKLLVTCGTPASAGYAVAIGWTTPMAKDSGMKIRVVCEDNDILRNRWMKGGLFFTSSVPATQQLEGSEKGYLTRDSGPWQVRTIWPITKSDYGYAVRGDSDIFTPYDIKPGVKLVDLTWAAMLRDRMQGLLAWGQVDKESVEWVPVGSITANTMVVVEGKADICAGFPASAVWYEAEAAPHGIRWIELNAKEDPEGAKRYLEHHYDAMWGVMSTGPESARGVHGITSVAAYVTQAESDPDLVYHVVKWLDENYDKYKDAHPWNATMTIDNLMILAETDFIPLHEGAIRYLKEKGLWTSKHEARNQQNIEFLTRWVEAYDTALATADEEGIDVDPENEEWLTFWADFSKDLPKFMRFIGGLD